MLQATGFRLTDDPRHFGLSCDSSNLTLAGVPLLQRGAHGLEARPASELHRLLTSGYGQQVLVAPIERGLADVARALEDGNLPRAMIAAILLKLPDLDFAGAARIAQADAALRKYDPDEPRDQLGRWTADEWTADELLQLPPGHRIDELGDLLEWIANANPEDAPAIRAEIKRHYYDVGDIRGGNALNEALSSIVYEEGGATREERQDVLDTYEIYTRADPAEIAQIGRDLLGMGLTPPRDIAAELAETLRVTGPNPWKMGRAARGLYIEKQLGGNLPPGYPVIDKFINGVATSIKSIDLAASKYQSAAILRRRINSYVDSVT